MLRVAIMQPYFLPYIGYFQLMGAVDRFVVYDDVQFTKKGFINRNSIPSRDRDYKFVIPCKASGEKTLIVNKEIALEFDRKKIYEKLKSNLVNLPNSTDEKIDLLGKIIFNSNSNLFKYVFNSIQEISNYLDLQEEKIVISSKVGKFGHLKSEEKVLAICREIGATHYLNPISGSFMYDFDSFSRYGITLEFFQADIANVTKDRNLNPYSIIHPIFENTSDEVKKIVRNGVITNEKN